MIMILDGYNQNFSRFSFQFLNKTVHVPVYHVFRAEPFILQLQRTLFCMHRDNSFEYMHTTDYGSWNYLILQ